MTGLRRDELSDVKPSPPSVQPILTRAMEMESRTRFPGRIDCLGYRPLIEATGVDPRARTRAGSPGSPNTSQALTRIPLGEDRNECADGPAAELLPRCVHDRSHGVPGHFRKLIGESRDQVLESPRLVI